MIILIPVGTSAKNLSVFYISRADEEHFKINNFAT